MDWRGLGTTKEQPNHAHSRLPTPSPREGVRPRPRRAAGPQRQGPHPGLRDAPGAPATASRASTSGPITRAFLEVLEALLWGFHNARTGCCFPSYEAIAAKAECARSTVAEALKALEWAGVLTWQTSHRPHPSARARPVRPAGRAAGG